jgi:energy-converting hydrogenase Eha subunit E
MTWLLLPLLGLAAQWFGDRYDRRIAPASVAVIGALGALRLLVLLAQAHNLDSAEQLQSIGVVRVEIAYGYWLALLTFIGIFVWELVYLLRPAVEAAGVSAVETAQSP